MDCSWFGGADEIPMGGAELCQICERWDKACNACDGTGEAKTSDMVKIVHLSGGVSVSICVRCHGAGVVPDGGVKENENGECIRVESTKGSP
jgi:DnaJ-class molecular chaperone